MIVSSRILGALLVVVTIHAPVLAAGEIDRVKTLYSEASYEAALEALDALSAPEREAPDAMQYRILCLLALGRVQEAERTTEALVTASPLLHPSAEEFPRRFMTLFTETRARVLPAVMAKMLAEGREHYRQSRRAEATAAFEKLVALSKDEGAPAGETMADMRTLAEGFLDLLRANAAPAGSASGAAAAAPPRADAARATVPNRQGAIVTAVPINQVLPPWVAPDPVTASRTLRGSVMVVIGPDGRVKSASMQQPLHPRYDGALLRAARDWTYRPATLDGAPIESERVITVELKPQPAGAR